MTIQARIQSQDAEAQKAREEAFHLAMIDGHINRDDLDEREPDDFDHNINDAEAPAIANTRQSCSNSILRTF